MSTQDKVKEGQIQQDSEKHYKIPMEVDTRLKVEELINDLYHGKHIHSFYKNVEAEIYPNFKNMLRSFPRLRVGERLYFAHLF